MTENYRVGLLGAGYVSEFHVAALRRVGNAEIIKTLTKTKSYLDFGIFRAVQEAAIAALEGPQDFRV